MLGKSSLSEGEPAFLGVPDLSHPETESIRIFAQLFSPSLRMFFCFQPQLSPSFTCRDKPCHAPAALVSHFKAGKPSGQATR